jgi:hypothetical protein
MRNEEYLEHIKKLDEAFQQLKTAVAGLYEQNWILLKEIKELRVIVKRYESKTSSNKSQK